jgi:hypothetical protein
MVCDWVSVMLLSTTLHTHSYPFIPICDLVSVMVQYGILCYLEPVMLYFIPMHTTMIRYIPICPNLCLESDILGQTLQKVQNITKCDKSDTMSVLPGFTIICRVCPFCGTMARLSDLLRNIVIIPDKPTANAKIRHFNI